MADNISNVVKLAAQLGIKSYIENGRQKFEASAPWLLRLWSACGYDYRCDHDGKQTKSWSVYRGGTYVASVLKDKSNEFAYSYTAR